MFILGMPKEALESSKWAQSQLYEDGRDMSDKGGNIYLINAMNIVPVYFTKT